jgi:AcrR family transcriptional regulator
MTAIDGRRERGARSRRDVMGHAVHAASLNGLDGLTIGGLAAATSTSKSGIVALFGSKQQLQLATVAAAREIFRETVVQPALEKPAGIARVRALFDLWIDYSESRVFAGGCFFASAMAEFGAKPGPVRDAIAQEMADWTEFVRRTIAKAITLGELETDAEPAQLAFEAIAILDGANALSLLFDSSEPYQRARVALDAML